MTVGLLDELRFLMYWVVVTDTISVLCEVEIEV
jgi:hypothetical protein